MVISELNHRALASRFFTLGAQTAMDQNPYILFQDNSAYAIGTVKLADEIISQIQERNKVLPFMGAADQLRHAGPVADYLVLALNYCISHIDEVVPYIHDMWTSSASLRNIRPPVPGIKFDRIHRLMKPINDFSEAELRQERELAIGDIGGFANFIMDAIDNHMPHNPPATREVLRIALGNHIGPVIDLACSLFSDREFLLSAARSIHNNWIKVKAGVPASLVSDDETRTGKGFDDLSAEEQDITISNVFVDWCAFIAFMLELEK